jgi:hypothetical protein
MIAKKKKKTNGCCPLSSLVSQILTTLNKVRRLILFTQSGQLFDQLIGQLFANYFCMRLRN